MMTPAERRRFKEEGYLLRPHQFAAEELAPLRAAFERLSELGSRAPQTTEIEGSTFVIAKTGASGQPAIQRVVWAGAAAAELETAASDPRILDAALDLLEVDEADQLINQAHFKYPGDGVSFPFHQDAWNRRYGSDLFDDPVGDGAYVQCVLTIDDMRLDNGPLSVVPRSHQGGPIIGEHRQKKIDALLQETPATPVLAKAGTLIFFGPFLVHGSLPNEGDAPRRILVNGFARVGANRRSYPGAGTGVRRERSESRRSGL